MKKELSVIVVPIYKVSPSKEELASLIQLYTILGHYQIRFICAEGFNFQVYEQSIYKQFSKNIVVVKLNKKFFKSIDGYNALMLSPWFYEKFNSFQFMLIYQLDAWVFSDQLEYWCKKNYDYIGAPWFENWGDADDDSNFIGVGNGGFSLRKIRTHIRVLKSFNYINSPLALLRKLIQNPGVRLLGSFIKDVTIRNNTFFLLQSRGIGINEDYFWGMQVTKSTSFFKVPDMKTASRFSLENKAPILFKMNNHELPFGCHAWEKYNAVFWQKFIKIKGITDEKTSQK